MLNKLIKHDFIATGRIMGTVYAVVILIMGYVLASYYITRDEENIGQMLGITVLLIIAMCSFILTTVVMIADFQKTLYGDQGYLSFTLPVKSVSLLTSKVITSTVWYVAAFACLIGTMAVTYTVLKEDVMGDNYETLESLLPMFTGGRSVSTLILSIVLSLINYFIRFAVITIEIYFAITLANTRLFQKRYLLWTIVFAIAVIFCDIQLSNVISEHITFDLAVSADQIALITDYFDSPAGASYISLAGTVVSLVIGAVLFYLTFYVMSKKVNIR